MTKENLEKPGGELAPNKKKTRLLRDWMFQGLRRKNYVWGRGNLFVDPLSILNYFICLKKIINRIILWFHII